MYPQITLPAMLTVKQAAEKFNIGRNRLYKAIQIGELRSYIPNQRDYLLKADEVEKWICKFVYSPIAPRKQRTAK